MCLRVSCAWPLVLHLLVLLEKVVGGAWLEEVASWEIGLEGDDCHASAWVLCASGSPLYALPSMDSLP